MAGFFILTKGAAAAFAVNAIPLEKVETTMAKTAGLPTGLKRIRMHNPAPKYTLGIPGEKRRNTHMATKKRAKKRTTKKGGSRRKSKKRNPASASVGGTVSLARYNALLGKVGKANPKRKNPKRRGARRNPVQRYLHPGGLPLAGLLAAGVGALATQAVSSIIPFGAPGSLVGVVKDGVLVYVVHRFWPKSFYPQYATAGAAAIPVANLVKPWVQPGIDLLTGTIQRVLPGGSPTPQQQSQVNNGAVVY